MAPLARMPTFIATDLPLPSSLRLSLHTPLSLAFGLSAKRTQVSQPPTDGISSLNFSPRANLLVATSWDNQVRRNRAQKLLSKERHEGEQAPSFLTTACACIPLLAP